MIKESLSQSEFKEQLNRFFVFKNRIRGKNAKRNNAYYFGKLIDFLGDREFNRDNTESFFTSLSDQGMATSTRRQAETAILAFVRWLFDEDVIAKNWSNRIQRTKVVSVPRILPSQSEVINLVREVLKPGKHDNYLTRFSKNEHKWCLLFIITASGTRNFETRQIKISDVSIKNREILIQKGKTGPRTIAIPPIPWLIEEIERRVKGRTPEEKKSISDMTHYKEDYSDRLFIVNQTRLEEVMREVGKRWNGKSLNVHDLRRICLRDLKRNGAGVDDIKNVAGHSDIKTTLNYLSYDSNDQQNTLKNFSSEAKKFRTTEERTSDIIKYIMAEYGAVQYQKRKGRLLSLKINLY